MAWRLARSLDQLRSEVNAAFPARLKHSDGTIGDPEHASRPSRHNPNNQGVVCALDLTHDPEHGCDIHVIARRLVLHPHPDLEYVISNGQVARRRNNFRWESYSGVNPHRAHAHFAVGRGADEEPTPPYDDINPWGIAPDQEDDDLAGEGAEILKRIKEIQQTQEKQNAALAALAKNGGPNAAAVEAAVRAVFADAADA